MPHLVLAINKMDLVDWSEDVRADPRRVHAVRHQADIPTSPHPDLGAPGRQRRHRSPNMPWYDGPTLLHHLEHVHVASDRNLVDVRFPVQYVVRPQVRRLPRLPRVRRSGRRRRAQAGRRGHGAAQRHDLDDRWHRHRSTRRSRGVPADVGHRASRRRRRRLPRRHDRRASRTTHPGQDIDAMICWMTNTPLRRGQKLAIKHTTRSAGPWSRTSSTAWTSTPCTATRSSNELGLNEIGRVQLRTTVPLLCDPYAKQPHDRVVHPHRRGHRRHRRCRHDQQRQLTAERLRQLRRGGADDCGPACVAPGREITALSGRSRAGECPHPASGRSLRPT
jgi:bifunctional enzyme CysN/CysC